MGMDNGESVWRTCSTGQSLGLNEPTDYNPDPNLLYPNGYAIVHINAEDGSIVGVGSPDNPQNAIITSAAGVCMASLVARAAQN